jgi:hypothetical protein
MKDLGADDDSREFLKTDNTKLNTQTLRPTSTFSESDDLIFMQIDADCDMLSQNYGNYPFLIIPF